MSSLQIGVKPSRRAAGRFISRVRRRLLTALAEEREASGVTQSDIARVLEVHRSVISRELNGRADITLGRVAEIAWALGREIDFDLCKSNQEAGCNQMQLPVPAIMVVHQNLSATITISNNINTECFQIVAKEQSERVFA